MQGLRVLSCFDGMSCGLEALKRAGVPVKEYWASEIDPYAIKIAKKNHPEIMHIGSITEWRNWKFPEGYFDLIIGGSPCTGFSMAGRMLNFDDPQSKLYFEFEEILKTYKPDRFLLENVKMKSQWRDTISERLGVQPVLINSALVSAQNRERYYWANFEITQPEDRGILLRDVLEDAYPVTLTERRTEEARAIRRESLKQGRDFSPRRGKELVPRTDEKSNCLTASITKEQNVKSMQKRGKLGLCCIQVGEADIKGHGYNRRVYSPDGKSPTLNCHSGGNLEAKIAVNECVWRKLHPIECERLQTLTAKRIYIIVQPCLDQIKNFVNAVEKNPKLQKLVGIVEKIESEECANNAEKNIQRKHPLKNPTVLPLAGMPIPEPINECTENRTTGSESGAKTAENQKVCPLPKSENTAPSNVLESITEESNTLNGVGEYPPYETKWNLTLSGSDLLKLCGKGIMERVESVVSGINKNNESNSISTILNLLDIENIELLLKTYYWYAKHVIVGYTVNETQIESFYLELVSGYTEGVSNTQRYKMIGNGWNVETIIHIFTDMLKGMEAA
jgi:DNA-cytosine methyltransferase